jgi:hypothetical protein
MCSANYLPMLKISHAKPSTWTPQHSHVVIWLVVSTPLKNISQLGWLFPIYGKIKHVPNHQPVIVVVLWLWVRHESHWLPINAVNVTWVPEYSKTNHKHTRLRDQSLTFPNHQIIRQIVLYQQKHVQNGYGIFLPTLLHESIFFSRVQVGSGYPPNLTSENLIFPLKTCHNLGVNPMFSQHQTDKPNTSQQFSASPIT